MPPKSQQVENTVRQLVNTGFPEDKVREAVASIGNPGDVEAAINWLLDHGEEDTGGAVEFKHCPHVDDYGFQALLSCERLAMGQPCLHGCGGKENWICLLTGETRCGRYGQRHSMKHWQETKRQQESTLTVQQLASMGEPLGHCLVLSQEDLSVWCYECQAYVQHEHLKPLVKHAEALKFGHPTASGAASSAAPLPSIGTPLQSASSAALHGRLGEAAWEAPRLARACEQEARPGYKTKLAHEYMDTPEVLDKKIKMLADLLRRSKQCVAYTGAGISTASGISDYATKAQDSIAKGGAVAASNVSPYGAKPTLAHHMLVALHRQGLLKHWVQQNHDGLPQKAGYPQKDLNEIHGAWFDPSNPVVPMDGTLRGDLIQWMLDWEERVDLCLALGTSMVGMNSDRIPVTAAQKAKGGRALGTVIVALQQTQYDAESSLRIFAPIDDVMRRLGAELGLELLAEGAGAASAPAEATTFRDLPYGPDGKHDPRAKLQLDLSEGSKLRIVNQQDWDEKRWGSMGEVISPQTSLQDEHHIAIRVGAGGPVRVLGRWWLDAAQRGEVPSIPVVPWSP